MLHKIAKIDEIPPGKGKSVRVGKRALAVFNVKGEFYAVDDSCSHMGAPLANGMLAGKTITCEWHGAEFDLETGETLSGPGGAGINAYRVVVNGDDLEVDI